LGALLQPLEFEENRHYCFVITNRLWYSTFWNGKVMFAVSRQLDSRVSWVRIWECTKSQGTNNWAAVRWPRPERSWLSCCGIELGQEIWNIISAH
jgi:hypothetical protein